MQHRKCFKLFVKLTKESEKITKQSEILWKKNSVFTTFFEEGRYTISLYFLSDFHHAHRVKSRAN